MKKKIALFIVAVMICSLTACGSGKGTSTSASAGSENGGSSSSSGSSSVGTEGSESGNETDTGQSGSGTVVKEPMELGKLYYFGEQDVLKGIYIAGNQFGGGDEEIGEKRTENIRSIFALNEWVEFYPETDAQYYLRVWVLKHREDQDYYNDCKFSDLMPEFVTYCDLHYPEDVDNPDEWYWGSFFINAEEQDPGYYDFVFTYEGKPIARMLTRFYNEKDLEGADAAKLQQMMDSLNAELGVPSNDSDKPGSGSKDEPATTDAGD